MKFLKLSAIGFTVALLMSGCAQKESSLSTSDSMNDLLKQPKQVKDSFSFGYTAGSSPKAIPQCGKENGVEVSSGGNTIQTGYISSMRTVADENGSTTSIEWGNLKQGVEYRVTECKTTNGNLHSTIEISNFTISK